MSLKVDDQRMVPARAGADQEAACQLLWEEASSGKQYHNIVYNLNLVAKRTVEKQEYTKRQEN